MGGSLRTALHVRPLGEGSEQNKHLAGGWKEGGRGAPCSECTAAAPAPPPPRENTPFPLPSGGLTRLNDRTNFGLNGAPCKSTCRSPQSLVRQHVPVCGDRTLKEEVQRRPLGWALVPPDWCPSEGQGGLTYGDGGWCDFGWRARSAMHRSSATETRTCSL